MLGMPAPTPFDLNFRLLGIPVRVSPWFWVIAIMLEVNHLPPGAVQVLAMWVGCVFASVLIHEYGHGLTARIFGYRARIVLFGMGGLCESEGERQTPGQRFAVLCNGPGAQFVLLGVVCLVGWIGLGITPRADLSLGKLFFQAITGLNVLTGADQVALVPFLVAEKLHPQGWRLFFFLFEINLLWPLLNLLPIYPLDGGRILQVIMAKLDVRHGARRAHIVSMLVAGCLSAYILVRSGGDRENGLFMGLFFAYFAFVNYQLLQSYQRLYAEYGSDDADWWQRGSR